ncbi:MAG: response regulator [Bacteroidota bacterium]|nr:response regulator [Bacteroidota bacterium]
MLNILLAEDNAVEQLALTEYLNNNLPEIGTIKTVPSCKQLLEILSSGEKFDIIILDHILEDEQSLKYIDKIKANAIGSDIIVLSSQQDISVCIQYLNSGVYAYLNKEANAFRNLVKNINEIVLKKSGKVVLPWFNINFVYIGVAIFLMLLFIYYLITK